MKVTFPAKVTFTSVRLTTGISKKLSLWYYALVIRGEQIVGTQEKPQQIVAQGLLSCLQYLDATKSSAKDLSLAQCNLCLAGSIL